MNNTIAGFKIENGDVYVFNSTTSEWEQMPTTLIPEMEQLLRWLEEFDYPKATIREDVSFEKEHDIGTGLVRSSKDQDGDLVYTYKQNSKPCIEIDEDAAFGIAWDEEACKLQKSLPINNWGETKKNKQAENEGRQIKAGKPIDRQPASIKLKKISKKYRPDKFIRQSQGNTTGKSDYDAPDNGPEAHATNQKEAIIRNLQELNVYVGAVQPKKKRRSIKDISDACPHELQSVATQITGGAPAAANAPEKTRRIKKRMTKNSSAPLAMLRNGIRHMLLKNEGTALEKEADAGTEDQVPGTISFISKKHRFRSIDPAILINGIRYNMRYKVPGSFELNFCIEMLSSDSEDRPAVWA